MTLTSRILVIGFVLFCAIMAEKAGPIFNEISNSTLHHFKWFYLSLVTGVLGFLLYLLFSRYGHITLGRDDEQPKFSYTVWLTMLFSGGMGIGLIFWSVPNPYGTTHADGAEPAYAKSQDHSDWGDGEPLIAKAS